MANAFLDGFDEESAFWNGFNEKSMNNEWCGGCIHYREDDGTCYDCARNSLDYYETEEGEE